jgi:hypothetical protein
MARRPLPRPAVVALFVALAACGDRAGRAAEADLESSDPEVIADLAYHDSLSVSVIELAVATGLPAVSMTLRIENLGARPVRAARGVFLVEDVYGEAVARFRLDYPDPLAPGEAVTARYGTTSAFPVTVPVARRLEELGARNVGVVSTWNRLAWPDGHQSTARIYMTMARGEGAYRPGTYPEINLVRER